jgi:hypothetical protein
MMLILKKSDAMIYFTKELVRKLEDVANDWIGGHPKRGMDKPITITTQNDVEKLYRVICDKLDYMLSETKPNRLLEPYKKDFYVNSAQDKSYYISGEHDLFEKVKQVYGIPDKLQKMMHVYSLSCLVKYKKLYPALAVINYLCSQYDQMGADTHSDYLVSGMNEVEALTLLLTKVDGVSKAKLKSLMMKDSNTLFVSCHSLLINHVSDSDCFHLRNLKNVFKNYFDVVRSCDESNKIPVGMPGHDTCKGLALFLGYRSWEEMTELTHYIDGKREPVSSSLTVLSLAADELSAVKKNGRVLLRWVDTTAQTDEVAAKDQVVSVTLTSLTADGSSSDFRVDEVSTDAAGFRKGTRVSFSALEYDSPAEFFADEAFCTSGPFVLYGMEMLDELHADSAASAPLEQLRNELRERLLEETGEDLCTGGLTHAATCMTGSGFEMNRKQLGRFMGMASYYNGGRVIDPPRHLKDTVCKFLGYDSYNDYLYRNFKDDAHDVPRTAKAHGLADFEIGHAYRVTYKPHHVIDFETVTDGKQKALKVMANAGSRNLKVGDVCTFDRIRRGEALTLHVKGRRQYQSATPIEKVLKRRDGKWENMDG